MGTHIFINYWTTNFMPKQILHSHQLFLWRIRFSQLSLKSPTTTKHSEPIKMMITKDIKNVEEGKRIFKAFVDGVVKELYLPAHSNVVKFLRWKDLANTSLSVVLPESYDLHFFTVRSDIREIDVGSFFSIFWLRVNMLERLWYWKRSFSLSGMRSKSIPRNTTTSFRWRKRKRKKKKNWRRPKNREERGVRRRNCTSTYRKNICFQIIRDNNPFLIESKFMNTHLEKNQANWSCNILIIVAKSN